MKFVVGKADEIPPGSRKIVRVAGRSIGVFNVAGDGIWICFVLRQPSKNKLEIYGFDEGAKQYVERYETEDTEQGIVFIKYYPTEAEWEKLFRSEALKKVATYERMEN